MAFATWLLVWASLFVVGITLVDYTGRRIERWSPALSLVYLVLLSPVVLIGSWVVAHQIVSVRQASCEELDPTAVQLNGMSSSEFRARCIATQDNSEWLGLRKLAGPSHPILTAGYPSEP
jgi:hypothetical protein